MLEFSSLSIARDIGIIGPVYPIDELDAIVFFQQKAAAKVASGEHDKWVEDAQDSARQSARRPQGISLPRAQEHKVTEFNPRLTLDDDLLDDKGQIIYPAGTVINPLAIRPLSKTLCFIDGDDEAQVQWMDTYCTDNILNKLILVNGDLQLVGEKIGRRLYFDQRSFLVEKFGIASLPAAIRQHGEALYVEEFPIR